MIDSDSGFLNEFTSILIRCSQDMHNRTTSLAWLYGLSDEIWVQEQE